VSSAGLPGKKWLSSAEFSSSGVLAPGNSANQGGGRPMENFLAVQMVWGVALARKSHRCSLFAFLIAFNRRTG